MGTAQQKFDAAANQALCEMLSSVGGGAASYAAWGLLTPGPFDEWAALGVAGLSGLAYAYGCQWDTTGAGEESALPQGSCIETLDGSLNVVSVTGSGFRYPVLTGLRAVGNFNSQGDGNCGYPCTRWEITGTGTDGNPKSTIVVTPDTEHFETELASGTCSKTNDVQQPGTTTYTDPDDGCQINVTFQGYAVGEGGTTGAAWKIEPAPVLRAGGGIIGGCTFAPVLYYQPPGGGGGGGTYIPWNPGPDGPGGEPWWMDVLRATLGGVVGAAVKALLDEILQGSVGGKVYRITSVCETDSQGEPISQSVEVDIPTLPWDEAIIYRLDALEHIMQGLKDFKQPICSRSKPVGDFVTVHFESDAPSIAGERPLRKYLRYRDQMASDLAAHAAHWENFAWEAGPVIVIHKNAPWGIVKVWAADADEGKRVIRHAGTISGINVDAEGEWLVTSSDDPRYGRTGTMRLGRRKSAQGMVLTISKRGGPDGLPIVPVDPLP